MKLTLKRLIAVLISFCLTLNMNGLVLAETDLEGAEGSEVTEEIPEAIFQEETLETITFEEETVEPVEEVQEQVEVTEETPIENTEVIPEETVSEETKVTETTENTEVVENTEGVENPEESEQSEETEGSEIASEETVDTEGLGADTPEVFEKTVYEYDDQYMHVTATLESADALTDSAKVEVAEIIDAERDLYLQALNTNSEFEYTVDNTVVFDIAFKAEAKDADGKVITGQWEEVKPNKGSVQLKVEFKDAKLSKELGIVDSADAALIHMPLNSGIKTPTTMYDIALDDLTDKDTTVITLGTTDVVEAKVEGFSAFAFVNTKVEEEVVEEEEEVVEEEVRTKTVYEYSDEDIHVTATFDYAEDMPDDAVFTVKGMDVNPYLNVLNADSDVFEYTV
ncbi:MAG: hypothetical protein HUJ56_02750, partial [Erysipelotrichaceae bacterium]|nr:hypothetical protein [Erysipelotrichaceae bacterium]